MKWLLLVWRWCPCSELLVPRSPEALHRAPTPRPWQQRQLREGRPGLPQPDTAGHSWIQSDPARSNWIQPDPTARCRTRLSHGQGCPSWTQPDTASSSQIQPDATAHDRAWLSYGWGCSSWTQLVPAGHSWTQLYPTTCHKAQLTHGWGCSSWTQQPDPAGSNCPPQGAAEPVAGVGSLWALCVEGRAETLHKRWWG